MACSGSAWSVLALLGKAGMERLGSDWQAPVWLGRHGSLWRDLVATGLDRQRMAGKVRRVTVWFGVVSQDMARQARRGTARSVWVGIGTIWIGRLG